MTLAYWLATILTPHPDSSAAQRVFVRIGATVAIEGVLLECDDEV